MYLCNETNKPFKLHYSKTLVVDRNAEYEFCNSIPLVCVGLEGTLIKTIEDEMFSNESQLSIKQAINISYTEDGIESSYRVIERPGAAELLVELSKHAGSMIYSSLPLIQIEEIMLRLSIAQGDPDTCTMQELKKGEAFYHQYVWSRDQCVPDKNGYIKSLGTLSEFSDEQINDIWLIDHKPEFVDFPSHVLTVTKFDGCPDDKDLYRLIDQLFIN
jgi:hypothetical protein